MSSAGEAAARPRTTPGPRATGRSRVRPGREVVLDAAVENFQRLGYHGTSMRDIARDAGLTAASIYNHFASKQQILHEIMVRVLTDSLDDVRAARDGAGPAAGEQLAAVMHAWVVFHTQRRAEAMIGASEIRSLEEESRRVVVALRDEIEQLFRGVVDRGVASGEFRTPNPREATWAIITMGNTVASFYRPGGELGPTEMAERYVPLALGTVGVPPGDPR